jgi:hypothetical protein
MSGTKGRPAELGTTSNIAGIVPDGADVPTDTCKWCTIPKPPSTEVEAVTRIVRSVSYDAFPYQRQWAEQANGAQASTRSTVSPTTERSSNMTLGGDDRATSAPNGCGIAFSKDIVFFFPLCLMVYRVL